MGNAVTSPFRLPKSKTVEHVDVRLADGRVVTRTADELVKRPAAPAVSRGE